MDDSAQLLGRLFRKPADEFQFVRFGRVFGIGTDGDEAFLLNLARPYPIEKFLKFGCIEGDL